jgi:hypothetical protein
MKQFNLRLQTVNFPIKYQFHINIITHIKYFDVNIGHCLTAHRYTICWPCNSTAGSTLCFAKTYTLKCQVFGPCVCPLELCVCFHCNSPLYMLIASWQGYCPIFVLYLLYISSAVPLGWFLVYPLCADFLAVLRLVLSERNRNGAVASNADVPRGDSLLCFWIPLYFNNSGMTSVMYLAGLWSRSR